VIFALTGDIRALLIKLAEKLHRMRALDAAGPRGEAAHQEAAPAEGAPSWQGAAQLEHGEAAAADAERKRAARECLDIYAPLAGRLGISRIKDEMEDLSLKFLSRETHRQIKGIVAQKREERSRFLEIAREAIEREAKKAGLEIEAQSRAKHFYSVYMKMRKRGKSAGEIRDLSGMRIICDSAESCYALLGIAHRLWPPLAGSFKDYIARPKPNGYQSLHTAVTAAAGGEGPGAESEAGGEGRVLEIQIRTREMHDVAEHGVASHWLYKKGAAKSAAFGAASGASKGAAPDAQGSEIRMANSLKRWKQGGAAQNGAAQNGAAQSGAAQSGLEQGGGKEAPADSGAWLEGIKREMFGKWVYALTPMGRAIRLPAGATPIDFAYQVHTAIGDRCVGAKAREFGAAAADGARSAGAIIPLSSPLKNAQVVEILTSPSAHPSLNWLQAAKSAKARSKIRAWLEKNDESFMAEQRHAEKKRQAGEAAGAAAAQGAALAAAHAAALAAGGAAQGAAPGEAQRAAQKAEGDARGAQTVPRPPAAAMRVRIGDEKNMLIRFARCCGPVTGDPIVGYVSRGRGIIIHRRNCASAAANPEFRERQIEAEWESPGSALVRRFRIEAKQSANLFSEIEGAIRKWQGHLIEGRVEETAENRLGGMFTMQLADAADLKAVLKGIRGIPGILGIHPLD